MSDSTGRPVPRDEGTGANVQPVRVVYSETAQVSIREDGSQRVVPITDASKPSVTNELTQSWRKELDSLVAGTGATAAVIVHITRGGLCILASSTNAENPYVEGKVSPLGEGRYCETVIGVGEPLVVADAASSPVWRDNPDNAKGIDSYYGVPLRWSGGSLFGSLCLLDSQARMPDTPLEQRVDTLRAAIEGDLRALEQRAGREETEAYAEAMEAMFRYAPGGIFSYSAEADEQFSFISVNMLALLGFTEEEFRAKCDNRFSHMVWHEDRERVLAEINEQISHGSFDTCEYRIEKKDGSLLWVHDEGHIVTDEYGKRWFYVVIVDITDTLDAQRELTRRNIALESAIRDRQTTVDKIPGGIRVFKDDGSGIVCINANRYYAEMIGVSKDALIGETFEQGERRVHPADVERHHREMLESLPELRRCEGSYRYLNDQTHEYRWYHLEVSFESQPDGSRLAYIHYEDIDELIQADDALQEEKKRYELAVKGAHLSVWEYDIAAKRLIIPSGANSGFARDRYGLSGNVVENVPESMLPLGLTDGDRKVFLSLYEEIAAGSEYATADVWFRTSVQDEPCCERISYYVTKDDEGVPTRAYGVGIDVTAQKREQLRFHQAIQSILSANPASLCTFQVNLTKDFCYEGHGISPFILKTLKSDTASGLFERCLAIIPHEEDKRLFRSVFDREELLRGFAKGLANRHIDYRRTDENGNLCWVRTFVGLLKNPDSDDVEGAIYSVDISHEKRRDAIFEILAGKEYEMIALLDLSAGKIESFRLSDTLPESYGRVFRKVGEVRDFLQLRENGIKTWVAPEDRRKYFESTEPSVIKRSLDRDGRYELTVKGQLPERGTVYRKLQHYYLDDEKREVLIVDSDVTQSYLEQQREMERKQQARLEQTLVDTVNSLPASSALYRIRDDRTIIPDRYSDEFCRMGGYTQQDRLYRSNAYSGVHPDDVDDVRKTISDHLDDTAPFRDVYRIVTKAGDYKWVSVTFTRFSFGDTDYLYAVYTDVDELKRQEQQLTEQYDAAQEYLDSVASTYLSTSRTNLTRNAVEETSDDGWPPAEVGTRTYDSYIDHLASLVPSASDAVHFRKSFDRATLISAYEHGDRNCSVNFKMLSPKGEVLWIHDALSLTKHPDTGDIIMFSAVRDATQEELVKIIMDRVLARQYDYISCLNTRRGEIILFISDDDFLHGLGVGVGTVFAQLEERYCANYVMPEDRARYAAFTHMPDILSELKRGKRHVDSFSVDEGSGLRVKQVEFFFVDEESELVATVRMDITEAQHRQLEQEETLRQALSAAEKANAAKSDFLSRMSHDMRTPLNGIIGMTYLTEELDMPDVVRQNLGKIDTSSKFLLGLINDILDMTKAESDEIELHPEPYPPAEFYAYLDAVIKPLCEDKGLTFVVHANPPEDVVPLFDKLRINQVLFNLLSNAVKFTPEGGTVTYDAHFGTRDAAGRIPLRFEVSDTGIGMSEDFQRVLFDPFTQEERVDASETRGTGLGLAIVKRLVAFMGGTISVKSAVGSGTTFTVEMTVDGVPVTEVKKTYAATADAAIVSLTGTRLLLCEDNPLNREIAVALLQEKGALVDTADNGRRAVDLFADSPLNGYDAVLMDIRMPILDGYGATEKIRALNRADAKTVPIIAMTADAFADDKAKCLAAGMNAHVAKPIDPPTLFATLGELISRGSAR